MFRSFITALIAAALAALGTLGVPRAFAQERFSIFVGSAQENVDRMMRIAQLRDDDVVIDLGSGDGRIVLTAAKANSKLRGWGVDIDEKLVRESNAEAKKLGMADRVQFYQRDVFDADLRSATVITLWMWPEMQRMLRTKILAEARPGTRVLTNIWDMGGAWPADKVDTFDNASVFLWVVPARVNGYWTWELDFAGAKRKYDAVLEQYFQKSEGVVRNGSRRGVLDKMTLRGADINFTLAMTLDGAGLVTHTFSGNAVSDNEIAGTVKMQHIVNEETEVTEVPWRATRASSSAYFASTGLQPAQAIEPAKPATKPAPKNP
ncbi:MAG TPA: class I SAM-dependent methyltransferase [Burkholderiales bacterium]|nr:class I SAM-dependent methyltransferase [Burkholderiales bacterium]